MPENKPVAAILMSFSTGCSVFLDLIQQQESADPYFSEGYHSENDSDLEQRSILKLSKNFLTVINSNYRKEILKKYTDLFKNKRLKLLETLETFTELKSAFQLVNKIIFSVIVVRMLTFLNFSHIQTTNSQGVDFIACFPELSKFPKFQTKGNDQEPTHRT